MEVPPRGAGGRADRVYERRQLSATAPDTGISRYSDSSKAELRLAQAGMMRYNEIASDRRRGWGRIIGIIPFQA